MNGADMTGKVLEEAFARFLKDLSEEEIPIHTAALVYEGEAVCRNYRFPYGPDTLQRMYSISKSMVSLAAGFLSEEGKLNLDDPVLRYFPEYASEADSAYLKEVTVKDILKMQTCHSTSTYKAYPDRPWAESFFRTPPDHKAGKIFMYDTSGTHTLCLLSERLSGMEILQYLRTKFLDKIGFSKEAYFIRNRFDEAMGGSGLMMTTEDMIRLAKLFLAGGKWNGEQILPEAYFKEAVSFLTPTRITGPIREERQGYGYQFWRLTHNGFGCYGMGGQFILCFPDRKTALVTTADTMAVAGGNQAIYDSLYRNIFPVLPETAVAEPEADGTEHPDFTQGKIYYRKNGGSWDGIAFYNDRIVFRSGEKEYPLSFGLRKKIQGIFPLYNDPCMTEAEWLDGRTLYIRTDFQGENLASAEMEAVFDRDDVLLYMTTTQEFGYEEFRGFAEGVRAESAGGRM